MFVGPYGLYLLVFYIYACYDGPCDHTFCAVSRHPENINQSFVYSCWRVNKCVKSSLNAEA